MLKIISFVLITIFTATMASGCSWLFPEEEKSPDIIEVRISNFEFIPQDVTIKKGQTVVWQNMDEDIVYIVASGNPDSRTDTFVSPKMGHLERFRYTFNEVGYFPYFSDFHASVFGGSVTVTE